MLLVVPLLPVPPPVAVVAVPPRLVAPATPPMPASWLPTLDDTPPVLAALPPREVVARDEIPPVPTSKLLPVTPPIELVTPPPDSTRLVLPVPPMLDLLPVLCGIFGEAVIAVLPAEVAESPGGAKNAWPEQARLQVASRDDPIRFDIVFMLYILVISVR